MQTVIAGAALAACGLLLGVASSHRLGVARAMRKWPSGNKPTIGAGLATLGVILALLVLSVAGAMLSLIVTLSSPWRWVFLSAVAGASLVTGTFAAARLTDRYELNALIRAPAPIYRAATTGQPAVADAGADPAVPSGGQAGWVYRDATGAWFLAVGAPERSGFRLVRLSDFQLVRPDTARPPLTLAGGIELSVFPLQEHDFVAADPS